MSASEGQGASGQFVHPDSAAADASAASPMAYTSELLALFNMSPDPLWICSAACAVLLCNRTAQLFENNAAFKNDYNTLSALLLSNGRPINLIDAIDSAKAQPHGLSFMLTARGRDYVHIIPLKYFSEPSPEDRYLVCYVSGAAPDIEIGRFKTLFGLTDSESRLVRMLIMDMSVREIAKRSGITSNTIRTQLKSIFRKTEVRRQTELVRLALSLTRIASKPMGDQPSDNDGKL